MTTLEVIARVVFSYAAILLPVTVAALWVRVAASDMLEELRAATQADVTFL